MILDVCKITFISILLLSGVIKYIRNSVFLVSSMFKTNNTAIVTAAVEEIDIFDEMVPSAVCLHATLDKRVGSKASKGTMDKCYLSQLSNR